MPKDSIRTTPFTIQELLAGRPSEPTDRKPADSEPSPAPATHDLRADPEGPPSSSYPLPIRPANTPSSQRQRIPPLRIEPPRLTVSLPPLPASSRRKSYAALISFTVFVLLPAILGSTYFLFFASNQYVTEFRFAVQDSRTASQGGGTASISPMAASLAGLGGGSTSLENYIVTDYITSRQALDDLQRRLDVRALYARADVDWFSRFSADGSKERFERYWKRMVSSSYDQVTGIAVAEIRAFTPQDAQTVAKALLALSEELVNEIATRPQRDAVQFAERQLKIAEDRLRTATAAVTRFRNDEQMIDPQTTAVTTNVLLVQTLRATLSQLQAQLLELQSQRLDPNAPMVKALNSRIKATRDQLAAVEAQVPLAKDGSSSISKVVAEFEQLDLERTFAKNLVNSALQQLEEARAAAATKHMYVTAYVTPSTPQSSTYPRRIASAVIFTFACLVAWTLGVLLTRAIREHAS